MTSSSDKKKGGMIEASKNDELEKIRTELKGGQSDFEKKIQDISKIQSELKNKQEECKNALEICRLYSEGRKYRRAGEYQNSIKSLRRSIDLAKKLGSKEHEGRCLRRLSVTYWELNNLKKYFSLN